jgi:23S rRNA (pseudouridine1915-N3)-methyltransferase
VVALDRSGALLDSEELARMLERWANPAATFLVGGPLGLHRTVFEGSDRVWSLSPLTFPHEIARALVAEQLYRAVTILRGVPYHK